MRRRFHLKRVTDSGDTGLNALVGSGSAAKIIAARFFLPLTACYAIPR
jgi:hypothetical protein